MQRPFLSCGLCLSFALAAWSGGAQAREFEQTPIWSGISDVNSFDAAIDRHLAAAQADLERMLAVRGARTVENTLVPFDDANNEFGIAGGLRGGRESAP
jgi:thimet oligopeptidase